eukprot:TRINITY_DN1167_c0_g1_i2.p1 TRINITY_DN1167_c0_g1~~TRINITY_DN1167_c0_g1_i2.p1  ORF type:complete len:89 (-),score=18.00 TRINITY_DN1167_c0_g1_i2:64-330(-)
MLKERGKNCHSKKSPAKCVKNKNTKKIDAKICGATPKRNGGHVFSKAFSKVFSKPFSKPFFQKMENKTRKFCFQIPSKKLEFDNRKEF